MEVKKAVIPCAGFGTRFLPITKVVPKELLPIIDKPTLQYIVEEVVASGINEILIIVSPQKAAIRNYFEENKTLNAFLNKEGKTCEYELVNPALNVKISYATQTTMNGNGKAIALAREFADGEPIAVLFGDDLMYNGDGKPVTLQLIDAYNKTGKTVIGCQKTSEEVARRCGVMVKCGKTESNITPISGIVEKPKGEIPSELVSLGRFILTPDIFDTIDETAPSLNGEVFLTDAISNLAKKSGAVACEFSGRRYDIGNKEGFLEATVEYALRDKKLSCEFAQYLKELTNKQ
ncbi:MAG: UTP--glucose-1-phosphate uridylyltransferase [Clostridia bacterium]